MECGLLWPVLAGEMVDLPSAVVVLRLAEDAVVLSTAEKHIDISFITVQ